ncbi:MAG: sigma-70 family RNA polymerase sigma factor [Acidiferrobacterales bacterium]
MTRGHGCNQTSAAPVYSRMGTKQTRFEALVQALSADLYRYAVWLCRDRVRAEELVQETFLRAWRSLHTLRDERAAKGWLITILRREHARGYERYRPELDKDVDPDELAAGVQETPAETLTLRRAVAGLTREYREPLLLQVLGGYRCDEIAEILGLSPGAVMTRLFRARQKLRAVLEGSEDKSFDLKLQL